MAGNPNRKHCRGCIYWKRISCTQVEYCNYLEETGHPRILICPPGKDCTVRETKRKVAPMSTPQQHAFDFVKKKHRGVLDVQRAAELYDRKLCDGEIARELGVAVNTICGWRKRTGRTPNLERGKRKRENSQSFSTQDNRHA